MPTIEVSTVIAGVPPPLVWPVLARIERLAGTGDVLDVSPAPDDRGGRGGRGDRGDRQRWTVLLNGSRVSWVQRNTPLPPGELRFEQVDGDLDVLRGAWTLHELDGGTRLRLEIEFHLGVDGLAPLLDPIWAQALRAHAGAVLSAVAGAATPAGGDR